MTVTSNFRGWPVTFRDGECYFSDTMEKTIPTWGDRPCGHCGRRATPDGHDGCLGTLPGIMNACCGHGQQDEAYVQFDDGICIRGREAIAWQTQLRMGILDGFESVLSIMRESTP